MKTLFFWLLTYSATQAVTFEFATIDSPGNSSDTSRFLASGAVDYTYRIAITEVSNTQYAEFLNAVATDDLHDLWNRKQRIRRNGEPGTYSYSILPSVSNQYLIGGRYAYENKPVEGISKLDAMRFINWLENGQPTGPQNESTTEAGVYDLASTTPEIRVEGANYFLPNLDEWYKAGYYDPILGDYWDFPTGSNLEPDASHPTNDSGNSVNHRGTQPTNGLPNLPVSLHNTVRDFYLTDVDGYQASASPYGTRNQGGNVWEYIENYVLNWTTTTIAGGAAADDPQEFGEYFFNSAGRPDEAFSFVGFRVGARIPEPSSLAMLMIATLSILHLTSRS